LSNPEKICNKVKILVVAGPIKSAAHADERGGTMIRGLTTDLERDDATRHELLSASSAVAPLALVSAPQAVFEVTTLRDVVDANDGVLSLREAIGLANDSRGLDTITFADNLRGGTIVLARDQPLVITDHLVIDGDRLDGGAGGMVVSTRGWSPAGYVAPVEIRGGSRQITATFEDLTIQAPARAYVDGTDGAIVGYRAAVNLNRAGVTGAYNNGVGIETDGLVSLTDSFVEGMNRGGFVGTGVASATGITLVESSIADISGGSYGLIVGLEAPAVSMLRSTIDRVGGPGVAILGENIAVVESTITNVNPGRYDAAVIRGGNIDIINSTISGNTIGTVDWLAGADSPGIGISGDRITIVNSTIANNAAAGGFLGYGIGGRDVRISNSIVLGNGTDGLADFAPGTRVTSNGFNVFGQAAVDGARAGDVLGAEARLVLATGRLADNGGPTRPWRCATVRTTRRSTAATRAVRRPSTSAGCRAMRRPTSAPSSSTTPRPRWWSRWAIRS
jgi:hypothetical protein